MKLLVFIIAICFLITANSCKKECHVKATDGIEKCKKNETCVDDIEIMKLEGNAPQETVLIINDDSTFKDVFSNYPQSPIDFSIRTLFGVSISHGGSGQSTFIYKVLKDNKTKEYLLQIRVQQPDGDFIGRGETHWVTIPKIETNYIVSFSKIISICS